MMMAFSAQILAQATQTVEAVAYNPLGNMEIIGWVYLTLLFVGACVNLALLMSGLLAPAKWGGAIQAVYQRAWPTVEVGRFLLLLIFLHLLGLLVYGLIPGTDEPGSPFEVIGIFMQSIAFQWAGLALIAASLHRRCLSLSRAFGLRARNILKDVGKGMLYYLATIPFLIIAGVLWNLLLKYFDIATELQDIIWMVTDENGWGVRVYMVFMAIVLAPVFEEVLFRGIALPYLLRKIGTIPALLLVSVFFAAIHVHLPSAVPLFIIATAFGLAYLRTGSLTVPITMHMIFNTVNVIMMFIMRDGQ